MGFGANGPLRTPAANQTPYEQSWSFGIERELPSNILINAEYIGKKGTHLPFSGSNQLNYLGPWVESLPIEAPDPDNPCQTDSDHRMPQQPGGQSLRWAHHRPQQHSVQLRRIQYSQLLRSLSAIHRGFDRTSD